MKKILLSLALAWTMIFAPACNSSQIAEAVALANGLAPIAGQLVGVVDPSAAPIINQVVQGASVVTSAVSAYEAAPNATNLQKAEAAVAALEAANQSLQGTTILTSGTDKTVTSIVALLGAAVTSVAVILAKQTPVATMAFSARTTSLKASKVEITSSKLKSDFNKLTKKDKRFKAVK